MGERGPPREPTALKVLKGSRNSTINKHEPNPDPGVGDPPEWLEGDAVEHWMYYAPMLTRLGVVGETDRPAFAMLCYTWGRWTEARRELAENSAVQVSASGHSQVTPYHSMARQLMQDYLKLAGKFGMSPSDRTGIKAQPMTAHLPDPLGLMK